MTANETKEIPKDLHSYVASRIRALRGKESLKIAAEKCNMSISRFNRLELGREGEITFGNVELIANGYDVDPTYFTEGWYERKD